MATPPRLHGAIPIGEALQGAPLLSELGARLARSSACLATVRPLLPPALRSEFQAGPINDGEWCLLAPHAAAAAKLRQQLPSLLEALQASGHPVQRIRVKLRAPQRGL